MMSKLINAWISAQELDIESSEYIGLSWAVDELFDLAYRNPSRLLHVITEILKVDSSERIIGMLGAGVLEDVLVHHGEDCIDRIIELSSENKDLKACLKFTFLDKDDVSPAVYEKFQAFRGV